MNYYEASTRGGIDMRGSSRRSRTQQRTREKDDISAIRQLVQQVFDEGDDEVRQLLRNELDILVSYMRCKQRHQQNNEK